MKYNWDNILYYAPVEESIDIGLYATKWTTGTQTLKIASALDKSVLVLSRAGNVFGTLGLAATAAHGFTNENGFQPHHYADTALGAVFLIPSLGWVGLGYYATDAIFRYTYGKSITEALFEP